MKIRRIYASDTRSGIRQVKQELGSDAVILANKQLKDGVEIVAAIDYEDGIVNQTAAQQIVAPGQVKSTVPHRTVIDMELHKAKLGQAAVVRRLRDKIDLIKKQKIIIDKQRKMLVSNKKVASSERMAEVVEHLPQALQREIQQFKTSMLQQLDYIGWSKWSQRCPRRYAILRKLTAIGLSTLLSKKIISAIDDSVDERQAWQQAIGQWARLISTTRDDILTQGGVVALLGPTGVGKTTTVAKLATRYAMQHGARHIGLISCDNYRIGAYEQLVHYGRLLGVPVLTASDKNELEELLLSLSNKKLILIDTAGMSTRDLGMAKQLANLNEIKKPIKKYLVLSANMQESSLFDILQAYKKITLNGCVLTKIDEASRIGDVISVAIMNELPFAYIATGQKVPEDIEPAVIHRIISKAVALADKRSHYADFDGMALRYAGMPMLNS